MICGGDEIGRTQHGNNNAYCQDNETSWFDWTPSETKSRLLEFTRKLIALRKSHPNLHRRKFFQDRRIDPEAPGPRSERQERGGYSLGAAGRAGDDPRRMAFRLGPMYRSVIERVDA